MLLKHNCPCVAFAFDLYRTKKGRMLFSAGGHRVMGRGGGPNYGPGRGGGGYNNWNQGGGHNARGGGGGWQHRGGYQNYYGPSGGSANYNHTPRNRVTSTSSRSNDPLPAPLTEGFLHVLKRNFSLCFKPRSVHDLFRVENFHFETDGARKVADLTSLFKNC